eukprot:gene9268-9433_t
MPPKAKTSKKAELPSEKELLSKAEAELLALKRLLELKNHEALEARRLERSWRERAELAEAALEQARVDIADIKADILRQHNTTQDHLASQVQQLESHQSSLSSQLEATTSANQQLTAQVAQLRQEKQSQAAWHQGYAGSETTYT